MNHRLRERDDLGRLGRHCRDLDVLTHYAGCDNMPQPPYRLSLSQHNFVFAVPTKALREVLSPRLTPVRIGNRSPLLVIAARFTGGRSLSDATIAEPYTEISYAVPVRRADGKRGSYLTFLKLHLDRDEAIDIGRARYGFPKYRAAIDFSLEPARVSFEGTNSGRRVFAIEATRPSTLRARLISRCIRSWIGASRLLNGPVVGIFDRGDSLTTCVLELETKTVQLLRSERMELPELVDNGILRAGQQPMVAFELGDSIMTVGCPSHKSNG